MQLHQLHPKHRQKERKRIGRGGKKGASSGFGIGKLGASQPRIREILKRYPKLKGYRFKREDKAVEVNLGTLEKKFQKEEVVNPATLVEKRIIRKISGKAPKIKILGMGELTKPFIFENCKISASAKIKIEKAGGTIR